MVEPDLLISTKPYQITSAVQESSWYYEVKATAAMLKANTKFPTMRVIPRSAVLVTFDIKNEVMTGSPY